MPKPFVIPSAGPLPAYGYSGRKLVPLGNAQLAPTGASNRYSVLQTDCSGDEDGASGHAPAPAAGVVAPEPAAGAIAPEPAANDGNSKKCSRECTPDGRKKAAEAAHKQARALGGDAAAKAAHEEARAVGGDAAAEAGIAPGGPGVRWWIVAAPLLLLVLFVWAVLVGWW